MTGMSQAEFNAACPRILRLRVEAFRENRREARALAASQMATMINLFSKQKVSVESILGEEKTFDSKADLIDAMRRASEREP